MLGVSRNRVLDGSRFGTEAELKTPWRDGTTHLVMSPLEFMQHLGRGESPPG